MLAVEVMSMIGVWWVAALVVCTVLMVGFALIGLRAGRDASGDREERRTPKPAGRLPKAA